MGSSFSNKIEGMICNWLNDLAYSEPMQIHANIQESATAKLHHFKFINKRAY